MTSATQLDPQHITEGQPACSGVDPELFYGPADSPLHGRVPWEKRRALAVCAHCSITAACLASALEFPADEQHGVIGGMTAGQRRALLATQGRRPSRSSMTDRTRMSRPRRHAVRQRPRLVPEGVA